jgi:hypothetical protein
MRESFSPKPLLFCTTRKINFIVIIALVIIIVHRQKMRKFFKKISEIIKIITSDYLFFHNMY